jgi:hypothetical protein
MLAELLNKQQEWARISPEEAKIQQLWWGVQGLVEIHVAE